MNVSDRLNELVENGTIKSFVFEKQVPSCEGMDHSRLVDKLKITFNNGEKISLSTFCSGCLENCTIELGE